MSTDWGSNDIRVSIGHLDPTRDIGVAIPWFGLFRDR